MAEALIERIETLEAIEEIKALKSSYCYIADAAYKNPSSWNELVDLFTQDGWVDFGEHGRFEGKEGVHRFFAEKAHNFVSYAAHMVSNEIVDVNGTQARGNWYLICPSTDRSSKTALWIQGRYEDEFVKLNGKWMWQSITFITHFAAPFDVGWSGL